MDSKQNMELKVIDLNQKSFIANGKEYFIEKSFSKERFLMYQKYQIELPFETGFSGIHSALTKAYELLDKQKLADAAVIMHNALSGIKNTGERRIIALEMCALFINTADEDRKTITQDLVDAKLKDWETEGLDVVPFFQLAISSITGFKKVYSEIIQSSLEEPINL